MLCTRCNVCWIARECFCEDVSLFKVSLFSICLSTFLSTFSRTLIRSNQISSTFARSSWKLFSISTYITVFARKNKSSNTRKNEKCARNIENELLFLFSFFSFDDSSHFHENSFLQFANSLLRSIISFNTRTIWTTLTETTIYHFSLNVLRKTSSHWKNHCEINSWRFAKLYNMKLLNKIESD